MARGGVSVYTTGLFCPLSREQHGLRAPKGMEEPPESEAQLRGAVSAARRSGSPVLIRRPVWHSCPGAKMTMSLTPCCTGISMWLRFLKANRLGPLFMLVELPKLRTHENEVGYYLLLTVCESKKGPSAAQEGSIQPEVPFPKSWIRTLIKQSLK